MRELLVALEARHLRGRVAVLQGNSPAEGVNSPAEGAEGVNSPAEGSNSPAGVLPSCKLRHSRHVQGATPWIPHPTSHHPIEEEGDANVTPGVTHV
eukprot:1193939-Prorocentrum_minimum.AAC.4